MCASGEDVHDAFDGSDADDDDAGEVADGPPSCGLWECWRSRLSATTMRGRGSRDGQNDDHQSRFVRKVGSLEVTDDAATSDAEAEPVKADETAAVRCSV